VQHPNHDDDKQQYRRERYETDDRLPGLRAALKIDSWIRPESEGRIELHGGLRRGARLC
jgi:hypothetical protein